MSFFTPNTKQKVLYRSQLFSDISHMTSEKNLLAIAGVFSGLRRIFFCTPWSVRRKLSQQIDCMLNRHKAQICFLYDFRLQPRNVLFRNRRFDHMQPVMYNQAITIERNDTIPFSASVHDFCPSFFL